MAVVAAHPPRFRCPHAGWASACRRAASRTRSRAGRGHGRRVGWAVRAQARWRRQVHSGTPIKSALHSTGRFQGSVQLVQAVANALEPQVGTASTTR